MEEELSNSFNTLNTDSVEGRESNNGNTDNSSNVEGAVNQPPDNTQSSDEESPTDEQDGDQEREDEENELKLRKEKEDLLTEQERMDMRDEAQQLKESGNQKFKQQCYTDAVEDYGRALSICPLCYLKERSIMYSNRAACYMHLEQSDNVIKDCTDSLKLHPHYPKPLLRRAQTYEKTEKLDEALEDYKRLLELDSRSTEAMLACKRLPEQINERNEKLKTEMLGKLKDLGNLVLRPFGLSTNNFNFQQNESGGYSVNFNQS